MKTIKFCPDCQNLLYPKEDKQNSILLLICRRCEHQEESNSPCISYRTYAEKDLNKKTHVFQDLSFDPALPRTNSTSCLSCKGKEAVFFHKQALNGQKELTITFFCCNQNCNTTWEMK